MVIIRLKSGMGNQMFQYAIGRAVSVRRKTSLKLDISSFDKISNKPNFVKRNYDLDIFNIVEDFATKDEMKKIKRYKWKPGRHNFLRNIVRADKTKYIRENQKNFEKFIWENTKKDVYIDGYWQSEKYFKDIEAIIKKEFTFKTKVSGPAIEIMNKIKSTNSVMLNIRRTDYLNIKSFNLIDANYIYKGVGIIEKKVKNPHYFLFSDDMDWCKKNIKLKNLTYVDHKYAGKKFDFYLQLMINCKHFVIPNSTFAWWSAWLANNPNKIVIAPLKWHNEKYRENKNDLIPNSWIKI